NAHRKLLDHLAQEIRDPETILRVKSRVCRPRGKGGIDAAPGSAAWLARRDRGEEASGEGMVRRPARPHLRLIREDRGRADRPASGLGAGPLRTHALAAWRRDGGRKRRRRRDVDDE